MASIVVDANVLFGALLRDGTTRRLILHGQLELHTAAWLWSEFERNRQLLLDKSGASGHSFDLLVEALRARIRDIPDDVLRATLPEAERRLGPRDVADAPYVAGALAIGAWVWSHDKRVAKKAGVPVVTTEDLLLLME